jgi:transposase
MNITTQADNNTVKSKVLYMAMELSESKWRLAFGDGIKTCQQVIDARNFLGLSEAIKRAKRKFKLDAASQMISCYEAGRDGFWLHRYLEEQGVKNHVCDSASIEVNRRHRRAKTDRLDAQKLLQNLIWHRRGEKKISLVRVPSAEEEDNRRRHRERSRLKKERTAHRSRIKSLLSLHGIRVEGKLSKERIKECKDWWGKPLGKYITEELTREIDRLELVENQLKGIEEEMQEEIKTKEDEAYKLVRTLKSLRGIGTTSAWVLVMEWFSWRKFKNRREVGGAAGLVGTPYDSGASQREQGISKAGNPVIRTLMIELSWMWLRYQPDSKLSRWFYERFGGASSRSKKVGIVALARKLLIALWKLSETGEMPEGAIFSN